MYTSKMTVKLKSNAEPVNIFLIFDTESASWHALCLTCNPEAYDVMA